MMMEESLAEQKKLLSRNDFYQFVKESIYFDRIIFEALGNPHLMFLFERLSNVLFLMYRTNHQREDWDHSRSILEHQMIVDAIENENHVEVEMLLYEHYHQTYTEKMNEKRVVNGA
jgi:DNA-binding GntR family transcriptional regulator